MLPNFPWTCTYMYNAMGCFGFIINTALCENYSIAQKWMNFEIMENIKNVFQLNWKT